MLLTLDINNLNPHQVKSVLGKIMPNSLALNPTVNYRMNSLINYSPQNQYIHMGINHLMVETHLNL